MSEIHINVPLYIGSDAELAAWVRKNPEKFSDAMDLDATQHDERATIDEITITEVEIDSAGIVIHYEYQYSAYYGCQDLNYSNTSDGDTVVGRRNGNYLSFERFKPHERRSTVDEF